MDGFDEKKWFVYLTDHHEGPFSLSVIQAKMAQNQVTRANFVWAEGMADWKSMTELPEFESVLATVPVVPAAESVIAPSPASAFVRAEAPIAVPEEKLTLEVSHSIADDPGLRPIRQPAPERSHSVVRGTAPRPMRTAGGTLKWAVIVLIPAGLALAYLQGYLDPALQSPAIKAGIQTVSDITQPILVKISEKAPFLAKWISPIPALEDVDPEEYEGLKAAAMQRMDDGGPKIAMALSKADLLMPTFYVASNLPDGSVIDFYVEGIPETLLNQLSFSAKAQAIVDKKLGRSQPVKFEESKPLPRGEYIVYATEGAQQPEATKTALANVPPVTAKVPANLPRGLKLLVSKNIFLGGSKDASYASRLKEFHDKLHAKATTEISEAKQFAMTLDGQLGETVSKFTQLRTQVRKGKVPPATRKTWDTFKKKWNELNDQFKSSYVKWTPEALQRDYFYGVLYQLTMQAGQAVEQVHQIHQSFFDGKTDPKAFDIQVGTAMSAAQNAISALKAKIDQTEKLAPTPNGMPRREGP